MVSIPLQQSSQWNIGRLNGPGKDYSDYLFVMLLDLIQEKLWTFSNCGSTLHHSKLDGLIREMGTYDSEGGVQGQPK